MRDEAEHFLPTHNSLGEGALWSEAEQALYWVDLDTNYFYRWDYRTGQQQTFDAGQLVGCLRLRAKGGLVLAAQHGFAFWDFDRNQLTPVADPEKSPRFRFNDGNVDPQGRFWAASMLFGDEIGQPGGSLYRLDPDGTVHRLATGQAIPNGIGWNPDHTIMYQADTTYNTIYAYDYDDATGRVENRRDFVYTPNGPGQPDGFTLDAEGYIWSCCWDGWAVVRYDPQGRVDRVINLPVARVTSCAFGGPDLDELFITTASTGLSEEERRQQPLAGDIFRLRPGVKGGPSYSFAG
jgi:sugar lactone lactonase YvrE